MDSKNVEEIQKSLLSCFELIKNKISKKDKHYNELRESYVMLKESYKKSEPIELIVQKYAKFLLMSLETNNLKVLEKSISTLENLVSLEVLDNKTYPDFITSLVNLIFEKSTINDDNINYKLLNLCIILYTNKQITINGQNFFQLIRLCLNVFLTSKNSSCQNIAKITLVQIIDFMLDKLCNIYSHQSEGVKTEDHHINEEVKDFYKDVSNSTEFNMMINKYMNHYLDVIDIDDYLTKIANIGEEPLSEQNEVSIPSREENITGNETINSQRNKSQRNQEINFLQGYLNCIKGTNPQNSYEEMEKLFGDLRKNHISLEKIELKNETNNKIGKYGWCVNCRKASNYISNKILFPICSSECEIKTMGFGKLIEIDSSLDTGNIKDDYINTFKLLSKLLTKDMKQSSYIDQINLKLREFCLEILQSLIIRGGKFLNNDVKLINVLKEFTIESLVKNSLSNEMNIFKLSMNLFYTIIGNFRENLKDQIEIFMNNVLITILESENLGFSYKEIILDSLIKFTDNISFFIELHCNYDSDINHKNIFYELIYLVCKIIQGHYKKSKYSGSFKQNQETILRMKAFSFISEFLKKLDTFVDENYQISNIHNQINNKLEEVLENDDDANMTIADFEIKDKINQNLKIKSIISKGVDKFNIKPSNGIKYLKTHEILPSEETFNSVKQLISSGENKSGDMINSLNSNRTEKEKKNLTPHLNYLQNYDSNFILNCDYETFLAQELSKFIKFNKDLKIMKVGEFLCSANPLSQKTLSFYIDLFNFKGVHILEAMRVFFSEFYLLGESQIIDRIMQNFGSKFHKDNPTSFNNPDIGYYLSFSIIMLQTDLHREEVTNKMTPQTFAERISELTKSELKNEFLFDIYNRVQQDPIVVSGLNDKQADTNKSKRVLIKKEKENILKNTFEQLKTKTSRASVYVIATDNDHVKNLFETCWSNFMGIFSLLLTEIEDDENIITTCIENIILIAKMCGVLGLDTITEAFLNIVIKMTNVMEGKEIKQKNIDCTIALINFAIQHGNYIHSSWSNILTIISNIDYYHTISGQYRNEGELFAKEIRRRSKIKNSDKEIEIEMRNSEVISRSISHILCDNVFSRTNSFNESGIIRFVSALCLVSKNELNMFFNPRNFALHKLIEVADFNLHRIQIEWTKIWRLISEHIVYVANTYNIDNICIDAIDSLRQIVLKLIQKSDLTIFNFQIDFFKPFENIFFNSINRPNRSELILTCISFITMNSKNIHSGWIVIFSIIKDALKRNNDKLVAEVVNIIKNINEESSIINCHSQEVFRGYIECLCHMYLESTLKSFAFDLIIKFISKIFSKFFFKNNDFKTNRVSVTNSFENFEYLKNFFHGFDDLIKFNIIEHLILIFETISFNKDFLFTTDLDNFIYVYFTYFKPQILSFQLQNFSNIFSEIKANLCSLRQEENEEKIIFKDTELNFELLFLKINEFVPKIKNDDIFFNIKFFLKRSLDEIIENSDKTINDSKFENCFFEISKNGGSESHEETVSFLKNIKDSYEGDDDLILKKIEIFSKMNIKDHEIFLDTFLEKFEEMVQKNSDSSMNYRYFFEDLILSIFQLSVFDQNPEITLKLISKFLINSSFSTQFWSKFNEINIFILYLFSHISLETYEIDIYVGMLKFIKSFINFLSELILNISDYTESKNLNVKNLGDLFIISEYLNKIYINVLNLVKSKTENIIHDGDILEILKNILSINNNIFKINPGQILMLNDNKIQALKLYNEIFIKLNLREYENHQFLDIVIFDLNFINPKLENLSSDHIRIVFLNIISFVESNNLTIRICVKNIMKKIVENNLVSFHSVKN